MDFDQTRPDSIGSAIHAAIANDVSALQKLSAKGHSMRICDNRGWTPLHHAVELGHHECIEWLIRQGIDHDLCNILNLKEIRGNA